jgi:competence ComEA-like helix-hairpin-helix protein
MGPSLMGHNKKDKRLLVLLALGALIIFFNLNLNPVSGNRLTDFYWLELGETNQSVYRSSNHSQIVSFSRAHGKDNSVPLEKTTLDTLSEVIAHQKVVAASIVPGESFTLAPVSPVLSFFLSQPLLINNADPEELALIPGIGPVLAGKIIVHRQKNGPFNDKNSLLAVPGIGPKTASRITPFFRFE